VRAPVFIFDPARLEVACYERSSSVHTNTVAPRAFMFGDESLSLFSAVRWNNRVIESGGMSVASKFGPACQDIELATRFNQRDRHPDRAIKRTPHLTDHVLAAYVRQAVYDKHGRQKGHRRYLYLVHVARLRDDARISAGFPLHPVPAGNSYPSSSKERYEGDTYLGTVPLATVHDTLNQRPQLVVEQHILDALLTASDVRIPPAQITPDVFVRFQREYEVDWLKEFI
jgi:hypothetical protein